MTKDQRTAFVAEMERRFRLRTPTDDPNYVNANTRVGRSEMVTWAKDHGFPEFDITDTVDPELVKDIKRFWSRMKREFPDEMW